MYSDMSTTTPENVEKDCFQTPISKEKAKFIEENGNNTLFPKVGMKFNSEKESYHLYDNYAHSIGCGIWKIWTNKNKNNKVYRRRFCCLMVDEKEEDKRFEHVKHLYGSMWCNYKAYMMIILIEGRK